MTSASHETPPRIIFVASISGGTGSGMLADLAYAARHELRNVGFADAAIDSVLLHSTPIGTGRDKAILNAVATMSELQHYSSLGSFYPGEPLLQIPPFHGDNKTFASTHFLHLGNDLDGPKFARAIDNVAEHLYCRLMTNLDQTLSSARSHSPNGSQTVDLVKVCQVGGYAGSFVNDLARQICVEVINGWCGLEVESDFGKGSATSAATLQANAIKSGPNARNQQLTAESEAQAIECGIDIEPLFKRAREMFLQEITASPTDFLKEQFDEVIKAVDDDLPDHEFACLVIAMQDRALGLDFGERPSNNPRNTLFDLLNPRLTSQAMPIVAKFVGWVCDLIDLPNYGVDAARIVAEAERDCIRDLIGALGKVIQERQTSQRNLRIQLTTLPSPDAVQNTSRGWLLRRANPRAKLAEKLTKLGLSSFEELLGVLVHSQLRVIEANLSIIIDELMSVWQELNQLGKRIGNEVTTANSLSEPPSDYEQVLRKQLLGYRPQLVKELRARMEQEVLTGPKKLQRYVQQRCSYDQEIGDPLRDHARRVVLNRIKQVLCIALGKNSQDKQMLGLNFDTVLAGILQEQWALVGGDEERAVMVVPDEIRETVFQDWTSPGLPCVSILPARTNNVTICRERRESTIQEVLESITNGQDKVMTVAANLHTRIDVEWTTLTSAVPAAMESNLSPDGWGEVSKTVQLNY